MQTTIGITNCPHRIKLNDTLIDGKFTESEGNFFCVKYKVQVTMKNCANRCDTQVTKVEPYTFEDDSCDMTNEDWERLSYDKIEPANRKERRKMMQRKAYMTTAGGDHQLSKAELKKVIEYKRRTRQTFLVKGVE